MKTTIKFADLSSEERRVIEESVNDILLRFGINTKVDVMSRKIYDGREMVFSVTSPIPVTPAIFRYVTVEGSGFIVRPKDENAKENFYNLTLRLSYRFTYFDGGTNGTDIGNAEFVIYHDPENPDKNWTQFKHFWTR